MSPPRHWRFRCPEGHANWTARPDNERDRSIHCQSCGRYWSQVLDLKLGKLINRRDMNA